MISETAATEAMLALASLPFFPPSPDGPARGLIINELMSMCGDEDQLAWLVQRAVRLWSRWQGPRELRGLFCGRFRPADGYEVSGSEVFPEGVPSENEQSAGGRLPEWKPPLLPEGATKYTAEDAAADARELQKLMADKKRPFRARERRSGVPARLQVLTTAPVDRTPLAPAESPAAGSRQVTAEEMAAAIESAKSSRLARYEKALQVLADPNATPDEKFMAGEIIAGYQS